MIKLENKRVIVTGANGFIGVHLCKKLKEYGAIVGTLDQTESRTNETNAYIGDISDFEFVKKSCHAFQPNFVIHLAAFKGRTTNLEDFRSAINSNIVGTLNLIEALSQLSTLNKFVAVGTAEEYGLGSSPFSSLQREIPISSYSFSKVCMTHLVQTINRLHQFPSVLLRPSIAYGPGQNIDMFLPALIKSLLQNKVFDMTSGTQKRDFIYIDDLVLALISACTCGSINGEIYNVCSSETTTIAELAAKVGEILGKKHFIKLGKFPARKLDIENYVLDQEEANSKMGWAPNVSLNDGLDYTIEAFKKELNQ